MKTFRVAFFPMIYNNSLFDIVCKLLNSIMKLSILFSPLRLLFGQLFFCQAA